MTKIYLKLLVLCKNEKGQSLYEYALILFFIVLVAVAILTFYGNQLLALFNNFVTQAF